VEGRGRNEMRGSKRIERGCGMRWGKWQEGGVRWKGVGERKVCDEVGERGREGTCNFFCFKNGHML